MIGWILALALIAAIVGYWLLRTPDASARAATAASTEPRETPVFLREADPPSESERDQRTEVERASEAAPAAATSAAARAEAIVIGRAIDRARRPIANVLVESKYPVLEARSDIDGRFSVRCSARVGGPATQLRLALSHPGYGTLLTDARASADETTDLGELVLLPSGAISGRVLDEHGAPFPLAELRVTTVETVPQGPAYHRPWRSLVDGACDAMGNFRIADVRAGSVRVWAGADEHMWAVSDALEVPELGELSGVELVLRKIERESLIQITVVDPAGAPVPRAKIAHFVAIGGGSWSGSANADEEGRYSHVVQARAPHDFRASDVERRYRPAVANGVEPGTLDLVMRLAPSKRLQMSVHDADGAPVERFRVDMDTRRGAATENLVPDGTHAGGRADFELPVETFSFSVDAAGYELEIAGPFDPTTLGSEIDVTLTAVPGVRGVVLAAGRPLGGAKVALYAEVPATHEHIVNGFLARSRTSRTIQATTGADGSFLLSLREFGRFYVRATADGWAPGEIGALELDPALGARDLVIELVRGGAVAGRVLVEPGESSARLIVGASRGDGFGVTTRSDAEGRYRFDQLTPGRWWIGRHDRDVSGEGSSSQTGSTRRAVEIPWNCVVRDGETTQFDVEPPPADEVLLRGRLVIGGKPAASWDANLTRQAQGLNPGRETTLDADGRFELAAREAGEFNLVLNSAFGAAPMRLIVPLTLRPGAQDVTLDVSVGRIEGSVASFDLSTDAFAWESLGRSPQASGGFTPDARGHFVLENVPVGRVQLRRWNASVPTDAGQRVDVEVREGATARAEM